MDRIFKNIKNLFSWKIWYNKDMKNEYKRTNYPNDLTDKRWKKSMLFLVKESRIQTEKNTAPSYAFMACRRKFGEYDIL